MRTAHHNQRETVELMDYQKLITELQAAVSTSLNGVMLRGNLPKPFVSGHGNAIKLVGSGTPGRLVGVEAWETSGANPILLRFFDGEPIGQVGVSYQLDNLIATIPLLANGSAQRQYSNISFTKGLTLVLTSTDGASNPNGTVEGVALIGSTGPL